MIRSARTSPALLPLVLLCACSSGPKNFDNDNDALRREREALLGENERLRAQLEETRAKLDEVARTMRLAEGVDTQEFVDAVPRCAGLEWDRFTALVDEDDRPGPEAVQVYLKPFDGRQRFIQVVGWLTIRADHLPDPDPADPDAQRPPELLATVTLGPKEVREAYRASPLGTHYAIRLPLMEPNRPLDGSVVLVASFRDAQTGRRHRAQRTLVP
ncbi:MAG: hypothetical protein Tsb0013_22670 [Phycisphaerales bacterium]